MSPLPQHDAAGIGAIAAHELDGRKAGETAEFVDEVRLVVEPAGLRELDPWHPAIRLVEYRERAAETMHARQRLRRESHLLPEQVAEMLAREAGLHRQLFDGHASAAC